MSTVTFAFAECGIVPHKAIDDPSLEITLLNCSNKVHRIILALIEVQTGGEIQ